MFLRILIAVGLFLSLLWPASVCLAQEDIVKPAKNDAKKLLSEATLLMKTPMDGKANMPRWPELNTVCKDSSKEQRDFAIRPWVFESGYNDQPVDENACLHEDSLLSDLSAYTLVAWVYVTSEGSSTPLYREWASDGTAKMTALITGRGALRISTFNEKNAKEDEWVTGLAPSGTISFRRWAFVAIRFDDSIPVTPMSVWVDGKNQSIRGQKLSYAQAGTSAFGGNTSVIRMGALFPRALSDEELDTFRRIGMQNPEKLISSTARPVEENRNLPKLLVELKGPTSSVNQVCFLPDGKAIAAVSDDPALWVWELPSGKLKYTVPIDDFPREVSVSPDGKLFAVSGWNGPTLLNSENGEKLFDVSPNPLSKASPTRHASVFSPDNESLYFAMNSRIDKFDLVKQTTIATNPGESAWGSTRRLSLSSDSKFLVAANIGMCVVFDTKTLEELVRFPDHQGKVYDVDVSVDKQRVVSASADSTICVWAVDTGRLERRITGHAEGVKSAKFTKDGKRIVSGSYDGTEWMSVSCGGRGKWSPIYHRSQLAKTVASISTTSIPKRCFT
jgi:dipeptidyl aminopeptidase/acylaminoacyl peptidase